VEVDDNKQRLFRKHKNLDMHYITV